MCVCTHMRAAEMIASSERAMREWTTSPEWEYLQDKGFTDRSTRLGEPSEGPHQSVQRDAPARVVDLRLPSDRHR